MLSISTSCKKIGFYRAMRFMFFYISISSNVLTSLPIFYTQQKTILHNDPIFLLKPAFYSKFTALLLLILLMMQQWSMPRMFNIAIWLRFIDVINISWYSLQLFGSNWNPLSSKYQYWQILHFLDALILLTSFSSESLIFL